MGKEASVAFFLGGQSTLPPDPREQVQGPGRPSYAFAGPIYRLSSECLPAPSSIHMTYPSSDATIMARSSVVLLDPAGKNMFKDGRQLALCGLQSSWFARLARQTKTAIIYYQPHPDSRFAPTSFAVVWLLLASLVAQTPWLASLVPSYVRCKLVSAVSSVGRRSRLTRFLT
jgi:hypothetical protein